jgi:parvulin-like peptidyl-prolyl isomerase
MYQLLSGQMFSNTIFSEFQGQMTPDLLIDVENKTSEDTPEAAMYKAWWDRIKMSTEQERYVTKYSGAFTKSMFSNPLLVEDEIQNSNNVFDVEFVMVPLDVAGDTSIVVSEKEIKDYYAAHKNLFPCEETRELHYIVVEVNEENEDPEYHKLDSVINSVKGVDNFRKAAMSNGYLVDSTPVAMRAGNLGSVSGVESLVKWAFKETSVGGVSEIYTIKNGENMYHVVAALGKINPKGYSPVEDFQVNMFIERTLYKEKAADKKLAEVKAKVEGLDDLGEIAKALGIEVSKKEKITFASADLDPKFVGAASVAAEGVVSAPFKGSNGIYVYKVMNRSVESYYTEDDANVAKSQLGMMYGQMLPVVINEAGKVKDNTYLYF